MLTVTGSRFAALLLFSLAPTTLPVSSAGSAGGPVSPRRLMAFESVGHAEPNGAMCGSLSDAAGSQTG
jgi:hypothetical protein